MHLLVLPVSGGAFVSQLAIIQHLTEIEYRPDIIFGSSGGNVAAYIAIAAEWKWAAIERMLGEVSSEMFAKPWYNIPPIAFLMGILKGNIYDSGAGVKDFFLRHFNESLINSIEVWTGTNNLEEQRSAIFCNRSSSQLLVENFDYELYNSCPLQYLSGNIEEIAAVAIASASIPSLVPPVVIRGQHYVDGGMSGASPLTIFHQVIATTVEKQGLDLHITYVNSCNLSKTVDNIDGNVFQTWKQAVRDLVRGQTAIDRGVAHSLINKEKRVLRELYGKCDHETMLMIKERRNSSRYSLLEIFPVESYEVDITNFTGKESAEVLHEAYRNCEVHLWYYPPI